MGGMNRLASVPYEAASSILNLIVVRYPPFPMHETLFVRYAVCPDPGGDFLQKAAGPSSLWSVEHHEEDVECLHHHLLHREIWRGGSGREAVQRTARRLNRFRVCCWRSRAVTMLPRPELDCLLCPLRVCVGRRNPHLSRESREKKTKCGQIAPRTHSDGPVSQTLLATTSKARAATRLRNPR